MKKINVFVTGLKSYGSSLLVGIIVMVVIMALNQVVDVERPFALWFLVMLGGIPLLGYFHQTFWEWDK